MNAQRSKTKMAENEELDLQHDHKGFYCGYCSQCGTQIERECIFCPQCGVNIERGYLSHTLTLGNHSLSEREIIESYFYSGFEYESILQFLSKFHAIKMSMCTLKRRLKMFGLQRNHQEVNMNEVTEIMRRELSQSGCLFGYRTMWHILRIKYGILVPRNLVQIRLKELDPQGSQDRRRHRLKRRVYNVPGPSYCWHVDGYDKIKPYGFPVHGAVDGYSRRLLWLKVGRTNNDPAVTAKYFYDCVEELEGCPRLLRTDCGTENGLMATMQCLLRAGGEDELVGEKSHRYGPSTSNQRIESFWSQLRKGCATWWMNFFKDLSDRGILNLGNTIHMEALWFCFNQLLQQDLDFFYAILEYTLHPPVKA